MTDRNDEDIEERLVALTRDLILIPSIPSRPEDRQRCYEFIRNHLESITHIQIKEYKQDGIPSLVALPQGIDHPKVLMCGHLDVITHPDISCYRSRIEGRRIYGPGAGDMKGALAIMLEVFRKIHLQKPDVALGIVVTSDEETGGECGIGYLTEKENVRCDEAMIPDGGSIDKITIAEKGILHLNARFLGRTAHASRPWNGENAVEKMIRKLYALDKHFQQKKLENTNWYPTCSMTIVQTENKQVNRIPSEAIATLDIRFPPPYTAEKMLAEIKEFFSDEAELEVIISANSTNLSPDPDYQKTSEEVTGKSVELIQEDGGSDARFFADLGISCMISRPNVGNLHATNEWIDIDSMVQFYHIYEKFLWKKFLM